MHWYSNGIGRNKIKNEMIMCIIPIISVFLYMIIENVAVQNVIGFTIIGIMAFLDLDAFYYTVLLLIPSAQLVNINGKTSIVMLLMVLYLMKYIVLGRKITRNIDILISFSMLIVFAILNFIIGSHEQIVMMFKHIFFTIFFVSNYFRIIKNEDNFFFYYQTTISIAIGTIITALISIIVYGFPQFGVRWSFAPEISINESAIMTTAIIVNLLYICIVLGKERLNSRQKINNYFLICICFILGIFSQSRSFFLGLMIAFFCFIIFATNLRTWLKLVAGILIVIAIFALVISMNSTLRTFAFSILSRFTEADVSNHRFDLWNQTIYKMFSNSSYKWMGAGNYSYLEVTYEGANEYKQAHNVFLETWVNFGFVGCTLLVINYYIVIKKMLNIEGEKFFKLVMMVPIITLMAMLFVSHYFIGKTMSIVFLLCFCPLSIEIHGKNAGLMVNVYEHKK